MELYPNAELCYQKAIENGFEMAELPLFRARCLSETGDTEGAVAILKEIIDTDHKYSNRARCEIGHIYVRLNDGDNALKWFNEAIERHENYAEALGGAALAYTLKKDFQKGEEYLRMASINQIDDLHGFMRYFKEIQGVVMFESHTGSSTAAETKSDSAQN